MPDNTLSTLGNIRTKIRRLTRSPSSSQLTDADIDEYVNNFILYDFASEVKLDALRTSLVFYTQPYIDTYSTNTTDPTDPLYKFIDKYYRIQKPAYIGGYPAYITESQESLYSLFPRRTATKTITTGDGFTNFFVGTFQNNPVLRKSIVFSSVDPDGNPILAYDDGQGNIIGDVPEPAYLVLGTNKVDYVTGDYNLELSSPPKSGQALYAQYDPYEANRPDTVLFYDNKFILRPVPDKAYKVIIQAFLRPTELVNSTDMPELSQWWQYIAYGAAIKVFQDRSNTEGAQELMPEFKRQELFVLRKTITQLSDERVATLYTYQVGNNPFRDNDF